MKKKRYYDKMQSVGIGCYTVLIYYWYWESQYFCIWTLVLFMAIKFINIVNSLVSHARVLCNETKCVVKVAR